MTQKSKRIAPGPARVPGLVFIARFFMAIVKKVKNLRKPANVGDRRFPRHKGGLPRGVVSFYSRLY